MSDIVVVGPTYEWWSGFHGGGGYNGWDSPGNNDNGWEGGDEAPPASNYPPGFDHELDGRIDALAAEIAVEINAKPDANVKEYGAAIWIDAAGNVHRTSLAGGSTNQVDISTVWNQVGGIVVAIIHSHPLQHDSNVVNGLQTAEDVNSSALRMSTADFDRLLDNSQSPGYDNVNYREYLVVGSNAIEFYAFDQDWARYDDDGGVADWAVPSRESWNGIFPDTESPPDNPSSNYGGSDSGHVSYDHFGYW